MLKYKYIHLESFSRFKLSVTGDNKKIIGKKHAIAGFIKANKKLATIATIKYVISDFLDA